ncbi:MAG: CHAT domain-containing protein [Acidobacteria bacterium]|nr:CHAT domain-containing protein [Acidobacteriota bacterium]
MYPYKTIVEARWLWLTLATLALPACLFFGSTRSAAQSGDAQPLTMGAPITRELSGEQTHSYSLTLAAGQYLQVSVDQRGCDVAVALLGPDGAWQFEADFDNDLRGQETLAWVAQTACGCQLQIKSKSKTAGSYVVKLEALRETTTQDADRVTAYQLQTEAKKLQSRATAEAMKQAVGKYEAALAAWKNLGDQAAQAAVLLATGELHFDLADAKKSFDAWNESLALWRTLGRQKEAARALSNLALLSYAKGEREKALAQYDQALALHRAAGDRYWEAETLNRIGWVYNAMEERQRAIEQHNLALPLRREVGDRKGESVTLNDLGRASDALGEKQRAVEFYEQALRLSPANEDPEGAAQILIRLGVVHDSTGESQKALEAYGQALSLLEKVGNRRALAQALNNTGLAHANLGDYGRALEYYDQSLKLSRELGLGSGVATTLHNIGLVYRGAGEMTKAIDYHNQALTSYQSLKNRGGQAVALQALGATHHELGDERKALEFFDQALALRRELNDRRGEAMTLTSIGSVRAALGETQQAYDYLSQALPLHRAVANRSAEAETLLGLAHAKYKLGTVVEARALLDQSFQLTESIRAKAPGQELRASYFATVQRRYELGIDLLMRMSKDRSGDASDLAALALNERARARSLLELLTEGGANIRQGADPALLAQARLWQQRLNARAEAQTRLLGGKYTEAQATSLAKEVTVLTAKLQESETQIRTSSPRYAALTQLQPLNASDIQRLLDDDTLLLEYALGDQRSFLWVVAAGSITSYELAPRREIEKATREVYALLNTRPPRGVALDPQFIASAAALSRMLLGPAASLLGKKRMVIVAPGVLAYLPFAALPTPDSNLKTYLPLMAAHEIVNLPSASVLAAIRRETDGRKPAGQTIAVLADPVFEANDPRVKTVGEQPTVLAAESAALARSIKTINPSSTRNGTRSGFARLAFSRQEAEAIFAVVPRGAGMKATDFTASRATATSEALSQYRMLHFATHGLLNNEQPELSGLVFSLVDEKGNAQDGFLRLHEVFNLKLNADLVVLSACETGLGKEIKGEGLIGLTRGFMYAGVPRVVASLWKVDDLATAELMKRFYRGMLRDNLRPAAALRAAQRELARQPRWAAPYFWAGFVLQGEWK